MLSGESGPWIEPYRGVKVLMPSGGEDQHHQMQGRVQAGRKATAQSDKDRLEPELLGT